MFQFTHPGKGATPKARKFNREIQRFNSRTLGRVRPASSSTISSYLTFQFTHPGKGATRWRRGDSQAPAVSIHAPWEGCDCTPITACSKSWEFQFTHPGKGATVPLSLSHVPPWCFNSRTLGRVRPVPKSSEGTTPVFQFTHPGKGATARQLQRVVSPGSFNSRTLGRVRQCWVHK